MKRMTAWWIAANLCLAGTAWATPRVGEKAPAVKAAKWFSEAPAALPGGKGAEKQVFIVEFWATWCPPCRKSIPHLAELQAKHGKDGLIVIGISNEEEEEIAGFMKKTKMAYYVGMDEEMGTSDGWVDEVEGIPHAFIVDRAGLVVWQGNPLSIGEMDEVLRQVLAGKYDLEGAKKAEVNAKKYVELQGRLRKVYEEKDKEKLFGILDEMIELKPGDSHAYLIKHSMLREFGRADELAAWNEAILKAFKDNPRELHSIAAMQLGREFAECDLSLLVPAAMRANQAAKGRDPEILATLAMAQYRLGRIDRAIETQEQAVALSGEEGREYASKVLAYFKQASRMAAQTGDAKLATEDGASKKAESGSGAGESRE